MRRAVLTVVAAALAAMLAAAASSAPVPPIKSFRVPGGSVECVIYGGSAKQAGVLCVAKLKPGARRFPHAKCHGEGDTGGGLTIGLKGTKVKGICLSEDPFVRPVRTLAYGKFTRLGGISCGAISKAIGVRCENANAHGFQISSKGWKAVETNPTE